MRRSITRIVPSTTMNEMTCSVSSVGNIQVDSAIEVPNPEYSIRSQMLVGWRLID